MSQHRITSKIEGDLFSRLLLLEGEFIDLSPDGSGAFGSTNTVEVIGGLDIAVLVRGLVGTQWTLTVSEGPNTLLSATRTIELGNRDSFGTTVNVPDSAAAASSKASAKKGAARKAGGTKAGGKKGGK